MNITSQDLSRYEPQENLHTRTKESRQMSRMRMGDAPDDVAALLGIDLETFTALELGVLDAAYPVGSHHTVPLPRRCMTKYQRDAVDGYARYLTRCAVDEPPKAEPVVDESVTKLAAAGASDPNVTVVAYLNKARKGVTDSYGPSTYPNPLRRAQALNEHGVSVADVAAALGTEPEVVFGFVTRDSSVMPWQNGDPNRGVFAEWLPLLRVLASGVDLRGWTAEQERKAQRQLRGY